MKPFLQHHRLCLTPLSPLHLGTGEDYEPTNYVIHDGLLYAFDPAKAALNEGQRKELLEVAKRGNLQSIQKFFAKHPEPFIHSALSVSDVSAPLAREYDSNFGQIVQREGNNRNVINRFQIERTATNPHTHQPYIPGSALKGCLRTALLEEKTESYRGKSPDARDATRFENEHLGSFANDLLRLLKPADFMPVGDILTYIQYATNHKKKRIVKDGRTITGKGVTGRRETIQHGQYRAFNGECTLQALELAHNPHIKKPKENLPKEKRQNLYALAVAANRYHLKRFIKESRILAERRLVHEAWLSSTRQLLDALKVPLETGQILLVRLGKNGGAESKTLEKHAKIKIMGARDARPTYEPQTKTVWLAAEHKEADHNLLPFGWALIEIDPQSDNAALQDWCKKNSAHLAAAQEIRAKLEANKAAQAAREERLLREAQEKAAREAEQHAAEQAEAERIARLPAWEQLVHQWREQAQHLEKAKKRAGDEPALKFIGSVVEELQNILADSGVSTEEKGKLAEAVSNIFPKNTALLSDKKRKQDLNPLLRRLRGEQ